MYLGYDIKNGVRYAKICSSRREGDKIISSQKSLGRVLDEKKGIFRNRERGIFTYDVDTDTYGKPDPSYVPKICEHQTKYTLSSYPFNSI